MAGERESKCRRVLVQLQLEREFWHVRRRAIAGERDSNGSVTVLKLEGWLNQVFSTYIFIFRNAVYT